MWRSKRIEAERKAKVGRWSRAGKYKGRQYCKQLRLLLEQSGKDGEKGLRLDSISCQNAKTRCTELCGLQEGFLKAFVVASPLSNVFVMGCLDLKASCLLMVVILSPCFVLDCPKSSLLRLRCWANPVYIFTHIIY